MLPLRSFTCQRKPRTSAWSWSSTIATYPRVKGISVIAEVSPPRRTAHRLRIGLHLDSDAVKDRHDPAFHVPTKRPRRDPLEEKIVERFLSTASASSRCPPGRAKMRSRASPISPSREIESECSGSAFPLD